MTNTYNQYSANRFYQAPTIDNIIKNYMLLSSQNQQQRQFANNFLLTLTDHQETWITSQNMIRTNSDTNFIYLGCQLLYQKIQKDLHKLSINQKLQLKNFIFEQLDSKRHQNKFSVIDKLSSSIALIASTLILNQWPNFLTDLTEFMRKSTHHLICGLIILQRIPQQLKMTNRISQGIKSQIQKIFLDQQQLFSIIFNSVFQLKDKKCTQRSIKCMQSWVKVGFSLMKYVNLTNKVLQTSLQSYQNLQIGIKVICQALLLTSQKNITSISGQKDPIKQKQKYNQEQINSLKLIIQFVLSNKSNFFKYSKDQCQYLQIYLQILKQLMLHYNFLILQNIGYQLLEIIYQITEMKDYKLSQLTFQFWIDFSQNIGNMKLDNYQNIRLNIENIYIKLFNLMSSNRLMIQNQKLMFQTDIKQQQTVDQNDGMTFSQYRKQSSILLKYIYDFFTKTLKQKGSEIYFKKISVLLSTDNPPLTKQTQLAIFLLKSSLQSMIQPYQTNYIIEILQYLLIKINQHNVILSFIPPIVLGQTMNFIRDCTRQIKQKDTLFLQSLKFVLNYINDQKLCHHSAYCFQILMETINTLKDSKIAQSLIQFYQHKRFTKQVVLQKMLQGMFNAIIKVQQKQKVQNYLNIILLTLIKKYQQCTKQLNLINFDGNSQLYLCLVQIKTILDSYDSTNQLFKSQYKYKFIQLANKSLQIVNNIFPLGLKYKLKFSNINQIGLCIYIYRICLKILEIPSNFQIIQYNCIKTLNIIPILDTILLILNQKDITQYYYSITLLNQTLIQFINHQCYQLNNWLLNNKLNIINNFFLQYYINNNNKIDTDIIRIYFTLNQSLILYNKQIFNNNVNKHNILKMALFCIKTLNQRNMQRKIITFINLSLQHQIYKTSQQYQQILHNTFISIPIINSICYTNLAKIYKYLMKSIHSLQTKQKVFLTLLNISPYNQNITDNNIKILLSKIISISIQLQQQRHIKSSFVQLNQVIWKKISHDIHMQLQLKLATLKKQLKNKNKSISNLNQ